ncbi:MAG TPA: serine/threonine-protein kinase, partial [Myxococcota bacterium]|nr:serine/threonine-protein kinase [Myxococcota bacterium]
MRGTQSTAPSDPLIGKVIDNRYRILSLVAQGGMGRVYQAEQAPLGRVVALKVLDTGKTPEADKEMRQRFILEAAACARLNHPNTVRIFDYGKTWDDVLYISMEYIHGRTLHHVIKQEAPLPLDRVIRILRQMCSSLREAHAAGLIHRDLKPSNVMLTRHGDEVDFVKVLDFGLVRQVMGDSELTQVDAVVGSPSYMSPEQIRGERLDQRSDIYSLGVLMYTCIVGKTPFAAESPVKVMMAHLNSAPPPMAPVCPALTEVPMLEWVVRT